MCSNSNHTCIHSNSNHRYSNNTHAIAIIVTHATLCGHYVAVESLLQPLTGEALVPASANFRDNARADIHAKDFWGRQQSAFLILECFIPIHLATAKLRYCRFSVP